MVTLRSDSSKKYKVLQKRVIVGRILVWFETYRRSGKDFERQTKTSQTMIQLDLSKLMLNGIKNIVQKESQNNYSNNNLLLYQISF